MRGVNPGFDSFDPPADGGRPTADATVTLPGTGEELVRRTSHHWIQAEETEISAMVMSFEPGFEGVDPHSHADFVDASTSSKARRSSWEPKAARGRSSPLRPRRSTASVSRTAVNASSFSMCMPLTRDSSPAVAATSSQAAWLNQPRPASS